MDDLRRIGWGPSGTVGVYGLMGLHGGWRRLLAVSLMENSGGVDGEGGRYVYKDAS